MADITNELAAIQVGTTGSQVRTALVDALTAINTEADWDADSVVTENSDNLITSGGAYDAVNSLLPAVCPVVLTTDWQTVSPCLYSQTITVDGATADSRIDLQPDADTLMLLDSCGVNSLWVENNNGVLTVYAMGGVPDRSFRIQCSVTNARPGAEAVTLLRPLTVNVNGVYSAEEDALVDGYSDVTVNVPNSYTSADEGKVVSSGALVSQISQTVTANGIYDTTLNDKVAVNVPNSYTASDEGKVVSSGSLTAQTSRSITSNGIYNTVLNGEVTVSLPVFSGSYTIVPSRSSQTFPTAGYLMSSDLTVEAFSDSGGGSDSDEAFIDLVHGTISQVNNSRITNIRAGAFSGCSALTNAVFPACTTINAYAFSGCTSLSSVSFPACTTINYSAFRNCSALQSMTFPVCTSIGYYAFYGCKTLVSVSFPVCTFISGYAFGGCTALTSAAFPLCMAIGMSAFGNCSALVNVSFPACTSVGSGAFYNCSALVCVDLPVCTTISYSAFIGCRKLTSLILTASSLCTLGLSNAFNSTPIAGYTAYTNGVYGSIYVPASLYSAYISASNWSYFFSRFVSIRGSEAAFIDNMIVFQNDGAFMSSDYIALNTVVFSSNILSV